MKYGKNEALAKKRTFHTILFRLLFLINYASLFIKWINWAGHSSCISMMLKIVSLILVDEIILDD